MVEGYQIFLNANKTNLFFLLLLNSNQTAKWKSNWMVKALWNLKNSDLVIYLGIQIDQNLTWKYQINHVAIKLSKTNAI